MHEPCEIFYLLNFSFNLRACHCSFSLEKYHTLGLFLPNLLLPNCIFFISKGLYLPNNHPAAKLSQFSSPISEEAQNSSKAAYAALYVAKSLKNR